MRDNVPTHAVLTTVWLLGLLAANCFAHWGLCFFIAISGQKKIDKKYPSDNKNVLLESLDVDSRVIWVSLCSALAESVILVSRVG